MEQRLAKLGGWQWIGIVCSVVFSLLHFELAFRRVGSDAEWLMNLSLALLMLATALLHTGHGARARERLASAPAVTPYVFGASFGTMFAFCFQALAVRH